MEHGDTKPYFCRYIINTIKQTFYYRELFKFVRNWMNNTVISR